MKTVESLYELISDARLHQEYCVREYVAYCNEIRLCILHNADIDISQEIIQFFEKQFVDEMEPLAKICAHLYGENEKLIKVQYTGGNNQPNGELDGRIIVPNGQEDILVEITTSCDKWVLKICADLIRSGQFPVIPFGWNRSYISETQQKGHKLKGVPIEEVFKETSSNIRADKINTVDERIIRGKLYVIANGICEEFERKKDKYLRELPTYEMSNDWQVDENSASDLSNCLSPNLDEMRSIRKRVLSEMDLTEEQFRFYYDNLLVSCSPLPDLIPGIRIISSSETNDLVQRIQNDAGIDWDNLNDARSRLHEHVKRMLAQYAIWNFKEAEDIVAEQRERIEKAIEAKLPILKKHQQQRQTQRIWLCIMIDDFIWNNYIEEMMLPVFENIANTYQNKAKLNHIEKLWFVGYKSYISDHSLEQVI